MPMYKVTAHRETYYEIEVLAESEDEARTLVDNIELNEDVEVYAYDWYPLEIDEIEEIEE